VSTYYPFIKLKSNPIITLPVAYNSIYLDSYISLDQNSCKISLNRLIDFTEIWSIKCKNLNNAINYFLLILKFRFPKQYKIFIIKNKSEQYSNIHFWLINYEEVIKYNNGILP
jgi:hypothetical protein